MLLLSLLIRHTTKKCSLLDIIRRLHDSNWVYEEDNDLGPGYKCRP